MAEPIETIRLRARHCRTCDAVIVGRTDPVKGLTDDAHEVPGHRLPCKRPDFGPEIVIAEVPW